MTKVNGSFSKCLCGQFYYDIMFKLSLSRISTVFKHNFKASNYLSVLDLAYFDSRLSYTPHLKHNYSGFLTLRYFISSCLCAHCLLYLCFFPPTSVNSNLSLEILNCPWPLICAFIPSVSIFQPIVSESSIPDIVV